MAARRSRGPRQSGTLQHGQHFLADRRLARDLVRNAGVTSGDHVVEIGAGTGLLTEELAARAGRVEALEIDPQLIARLEARFAGSDHVSVVCADSVRAPLPRHPYRVVANLPFGMTTAMLRRLLDDPAAPLLRADLVVQWGAAVKRARPLPSTLLTLSWAPWFELTVGRRIPRTRFRPPPPVDAAVLTVTRRPDPLLPERERAAFVDLLHRGFTRANRPVSETLTELMPRGRFKRVARELRVFPDARPTDLDAAQWAAIHRALHSR